MNWCKVIYKFKISLCVDKKVSISESSAQYYPSVRYIGLHLINTKNNPLSGFWVSPCLEGYTSAKLGKTIIVDSEKIGVSLLSKSFPKTNGVSIFPFELKIFYSKYSKFN